MSAPLRARFTIRARLTLLYSAVMAVSFIAFFWISDIGFRRSIEATVNNASRTNLETVQRLLAASASKGDEKIRKELRELAELWANGALFEVANAQGEWLFRSAQFQQLSAPLTPQEAQTVSFATRNLDSSQYRIALQRVAIGGQLFEIHAAVPTEPFDQALDHFRLIEKEILPLLVLLASLLGYWLSGRSLAPVNRIIETAEVIGAQNLSRRLEVPKADDELRRLTETLNAMLLRIETSFKRITQFTADASHDLRTPVAVIRATAEVALRRPRADHEYRAALLQILETSVDTSELLENLLTLARADAGSSMQMCTLDLVQHVRKAQSRAALLAVEKNLQVSAELPDAAVHINADAIAIDRLLLIILDNAVKYTAPGGHVEILLATSAGAAGCAEITIRDSGIGIAACDLANIFDRFYRADRVRNKVNAGAGLGLAIARWLAEAHKGTITAESTPGKGSAFHVRLPLATIPSETAGQRDLTLRPL
jgi:two-component system, OmpR family, heavy metal sensor histidine kinase CusS